MMRRHKVQRSAELSDEQVEWKEMNGTAFELLIQLHKIAGSFSVVFRNNAEMIFDSENKVLSFKRKSFVDGKEEVRSCGIKNVNELRFFVDSSSIEVFVNNGEEVFTSRFFPAHGDENLVFKAVGQTQFEATKWELNSLK